MGGEAFFHGAGQSGAVRGGASPKICRAGRGRARPKIYGAGRGGEPTPPHSAGQGGEGPGRGTYCVIPNIIRIRIRSKKQYSLTSVLWDVRETHLKKRGLLNL